jgi:hypothetical protein
MANIQPCEWLHEAFEQLPLFAYPYQPECIPPNGLYFLYESREHCTIGGTDLPRITRVGTHVGQANLPDRLAQHYMLDERRMIFGSDHPKPADRSIFRKNVGRASVKSGVRPLPGSLGILILRRRRTAGGTLICARLTRNARLKWQSQLTYAAQSLSASWPLTG